MTKRINLGGNNKFHCQHITFEVTVEHPRRNGGLQLRKGFRTRALDSKRFYMEWTANTMKEKK